MKTDYIYVKPSSDAEVKWHALVKKLHPKAVVNGSGAGTLLAHPPGIPYWQAKLGHFNTTHGGFVLRKGSK